MSIFSRIKSLMNKEPKEQIVGHSISELSSIFTTPISTIDIGLSKALQISSLKNIGIPAYYSSFLIDEKDSQKFISLVANNFKYTAEKTFNDLPVMQYVNTQKNEHLVFFTSTREFNSITVRLVTNSVEFLAIIAAEKFSVPPPWIAFEDYNPSWWGGQMQGAQEYYNDNYFLPFFTRLSGSEKQAYYARYEASGEWIKMLELMYDE